MKPARIDCAARIRRRRTVIHVSMDSRRFTRRPTLVGLTVVIGALGVGVAWFADRYDGQPEQSVSLRTFSEEEYPENPDHTSSGYGQYPHRVLVIQQLGGTRFRFVLRPAAPHAATIELVEVDLAHLVAAVPPWLTQDADLTRVGLIDREWNRQQVRFGRESPVVHVSADGDGIEVRSLSRVDLARNCLNAGLWEILLFTQEEGEERIYEHLWFTFPLGLYKHLFEQVNGLSYWSYWWPLEHWADPSGTPIHLDRLRAVEQDWPIRATVHWDEAPPFHGEQRRKRANSLSGAAASYREWYPRPVQFASFIPPGRYSLRHPRETRLHYLSELTGAVLRLVRMPSHPQRLYEIELTFRSSQTAERTRLIIGGLDLAALPSLSPEQYERGWQIPLGIANPSFFESYDELAARPPVTRSVYGFHLDADGRWLDHHAIGVDGPLMHRDADEPFLLHVYLLSYERHALLNHVTLVLPRGS